MTTAFSVRYGPRDVPETEIVVIHLFYSLSISLLFHAFPIYTNKVLPNFSKKNIGVLKNEIVSTKKLFSYCIAHIPLKKKCTWPKREFCVGDPTQPIFHWLALGFCIGGNANFMSRVGSNANFSFFRYQHVGIPKAKLWSWGSKPTRGPNANGFASQWNIGLKVLVKYNCFRVLTTGS